MTEEKKDYRQTEIGLIPEDWEVETVGEAFEIKNNLRLPISRNVRKSMQGKYPYYGPTGIQDYIDEYRVEGKHALIGEDGDHFLKWDSMSMTLLVEGKFNVNNHAHIVKGVKNLTEWFYYFFGHRDLTSHLKRQGAGRYKLNKSTLIELPCAVPPLTEQEAITNALSDVDDLIRSLDLLIQKKEAIKKGSMQLLLTGKTRLPGFDGEWEVKTLEDVLNYEQPPKYIVKADIEDQEVGVPVLTANKSFILGYTTETFGVYTDTPVVVFDDFTTLSKYVDFNFKIKSSAIKLLKPKSSAVNLRFIYELIQILKFSTGDHKRYYISEYQHIEIELPPKGEQDAIVEILSDMDLELQTLRQKREKYKQVKQGMMQELLTGKTRLV
ncbi:restriction endonuclease subunit S [Balneola sp. EhC07]|uniref:restriction endonuclease subunit S n=1 Tax=Balneola sp. EhC07 TaxID=1849360 RepID=UPI00097893DD|nr:restriction endonuclease subunit S [Balneola sp. EhC07]